MKGILNLKKIRHLICLALATNMLIGTSPIVSAQISGVETWTAQSDSSPIMTIQNNNLTPRKTMGRSGHMQLWFKFEKADAAASDVELHIQLRNLTTGNTNPPVTVLYPTGNFNTRQEIGLTVNTGEVYQIFIDICTRSGQAKPGYSRTARVQFGYYFP